MTVSSSNIAGNTRYRDIEALLASYPRPRPPLTPAHEKVYVEEYRRNRLAKKGLSAVVGNLEAWMHRAVAGHIAVSRLLSSARARLTIYLMNLPQMSTT